ncbi:MAG TPA: hypothetical protein VIG47_10875 [Gemmatimonadaceae bacterium]
MTSLQTLWMPILLAGVVVFFASSIIHMLLPWHKSDFAAVPNEDEVSDALRPFAIPPGDYLLPRPATSAALKSPGYAERVRRGPNIVMTVLPNEPWSMGRNLGLWFVYCLIVSLFAALAAAIAYPAGADPHAIFHMTCLVAFIGYAMALWQMTIWYNRAWSTTIKSTVDAIIYAAITGGIFLWLWPV